MTTNPKARGRMVVGGGFSGLCEGFFFGHRFVAFSGHRFDVMELPAKIDELLVPGVVRQHVARQSHSIGDLRILVQKVRRNLNRQLADLMFLDLLSSHVFDERLNLFLFNVKDQVMVGQRQNNRQLKSLVFHFNYGLRLVKVVVCQSRPFH